jgi:hypothetical protein
VSRARSRVEARFEPRFDYGLSTPRVEQLDDDLAIAYGGPDALVLQTELPIGTAELSACEAARTLGDGDDVLVALTWCLPQELAPERLARERILGELDGTIGFWQAVGRALRLRRAVPRRGAPQRARPQGADERADRRDRRRGDHLLPEKVGGERNWDYRYSWLRDSALTINALFMLGYTEEAQAYITWLKRTTAGSARELQIMYGVGGERFPPEIELTHLDGYRGSQPVRVGNAAAEQFQLDVYGEMLDAAWHFRRHGGEIDDVFWEFLCRVGEAVLEQWSSRTAASGRSAARPSTSSRRRFWPGSRSTGCSGSRRPTTARATSMRGARRAERSRRPSTTRASTRRRTRFASTSATTGGPTREPAGSDHGLRRLRRPEGERRRSTSSIGNWPQTASCAAT